MNRPAVPRKCADIDDGAFMAAVAATPPRGGSHWRNRHDVQATLEQALGAAVPEKLFLAKARRLGRRRLLEGCTECTCRGDYHLPRECHVQRCCYPPEHDWTTHPGYDPAWETDQRLEFDPAAFGKALAAAAAAMPVPVASRGLTPFDLSRPAALVYPH